MGTYMRFHIQTVLFVYIIQEREEYEQQEEVRRRAMEAEMARLEKEAKERERQRQIAEAKDIQKKHALERIEQLKKSELGARVVQKIDEEVSVGSRGRSQGQG